MKLIPELVVEILEAARDLKPGEYGQAWKTEKHSEVIVSEHVIKMLDSDLLIGEDLGVSKDGAHLYLVKRISPLGDHFLDDYSKSGVAEKVKGFAARVGEQLTIDGLVAFIQGALN